MKKIILLSLLITVVSSLTFAQNPSFPMHSNKMKFLLERINDQYVDTVNFDKLVEKGIVEMLKELDGFVHRVLSPRGKKTPEEVAILPAVVKILLKR